MLSTLPQKTHRAAKASAMVLVVLFCIGNARSEEKSDRGPILNHLNAMISWYRNFTDQVQTVGVPTDAVYQETARNLALEALRLAIQAARAQATMTTATSDDSETDNAEPKTSNDQPDYAKIRTRISGRITDTQAQLDKANAELANAPSNKRSTLVSGRDKLQGQLELYKASLDGVQKMAAFVDSKSEATTEGLLGRINQLARSVPEATSVSSTDQTGPKMAAPILRSSSSSGLIGQGLALYSQLRSMHEIDRLIHETDHVDQLVMDLRKPMRDEIRAMLLQGRNLDNQNAAASPTAGDYRNLAKRFKQISSAFVPLGQEDVVLDQSRSNLVEWRRSISSELKFGLQAIGIRLLGIFLMLAVVVGLSEAWRRLTFRYVHEQRRRRQFLVLRRFIMGFLIGVVLIMGFVSEFSSLATFAGFVTAGIAVGLQAVLLSVAAYFFVIGRYGIRVGDRISVAGVTGDVIDVGLIRMYLMELAGSGVDHYPTGRIVVFSNSVLFQATTPLFKQIPGTEYTWHEVTVALAAGGDYKLVQDRLFQAVNSAYEQYRGDIERQHGNIERRIEVHLKTPSPEAKLQFTDDGLEFLVRYPVDLRRASEVDEQITKALLNAVEKEPALRSAVSGTPRIRAAVKG